ncbi:MULTISPECIES: NAD-dependent epimerase/dehydratase family protein [unclassified Rhizobium]|uniref:NAD-dependent epimerase/dehydratase family protein n=1 Tax=Rhizobium sp. BK529 TaxID=2586983 RepID=UPI0010462A50
MPPSRRKRLTSQSRFSCRVLRRRVLWGANRVFITGAQGFVGRSAVNYFLKQRFCVRAAVRVAPDARFSKRERVEYKVVGDIVQISDWSSYLDGCEVIVHLAARAHKTKEGSSDSVSEFEEINVHASVKLAKNAAAMGIKRFVFIKFCRCNGRDVVGAVHRNRCSAALE